MDNQVSTLTESTKDESKMNDTNKEQTDDRRGIDKFLNSNGVVSVEIDKFNGDFFVKFPFDLKNEAFDKVKVKRKEVESLLRNAIDYDGVINAYGEMKKWHNQVGRIAHEKFDEASIFIDEQREILRKIGFTCEALDYLSKANFNRPDRDGVHLMPKTAWWNVKPC